MAFDAIPAYMDGTTLDGEVFRRAIGTLLSPAGGIVTPGDLAVTQQASPNMSVLIGTGQAWIPGQSTSSQGPYYTRNGAPVTIVVPASSPSNPRIDQIVVQIQDAEYAGTGKLCQPFLIQGTPTVGASLANLVGLGTFPPVNSSALLLANVLVPANATSIVTANIANVVGTVGFSALTTSWVALTLPTNVTAGTPSPAARLQGDIVRLQGNCTNNTGLTIASGSQIATLPAGFRPANNIDIAGGVIVNTGPHVDTPIALNILSSGVVNANVSGGVPNLYQVSFGNVTFALGD